MKLWQWIKVHIFRRKPRWIKRKVEITYWTLREAPAEIVEIGNIRFGSLKNNKEFYVDKLEVIK